MNDTVACLDVRLGHRRPVDCHAVGTVYHQIATLYGGGSRLCTGNVSRHDLAGDHVVSQYGNQLILVFGLQEIIQCAFR